MRDETQRQPEPWADAEIKLRGRERIKYRKVTPLDRREGREWRNVTREVVVVHDWEIYSVKASPLYSTAPVHSGAAMRVLQLYNYPAPVGLGKVCVLSRSVVLQYQVCWTHLLANLEAFLFRPPALNWVLRLEKKVN